MNRGLQEKGLEKCVLLGWILRAGIRGFNCRNTGVRHATVRTCGVISKAFLEVIALFWSFLPLTAAGFGDLHLVAASQQKVQPGDVKPRAGPRLLAPFGTAPAAFPGRAVRALPARLREARPSNARGRRLARTPRVRPFPRKKKGQGKPCKYYSCWAHLCEGDILKANQSRCKMPCFQQPNNSALGPKRSRAASPRAAAARCSSLPLPFVSGRCWYLFTQAFAWGTAGDL